MNIVYCNLIYSTILYIRVTYLLFVLLSFSANGFLSLVTFGVKHARFR